MKVEDIVIIGSGPAGLTAALYAARGNRNPVLITGNEFGGQIATTADVENYPGLPETTGPVLVENMKMQAETFGTRFVYDEVTEIDFSGSVHRIKTHGEEFYAKVVIVTTGASPRKLGVPGETENVGRGVSYCATCDGFFFRNKEVIVVGGGDSAVEEGLFLTKFANRVRIVHRRDQLRAGQLLQDRAKANPKIQFVWNTVVDEIVHADGKVVKARVTNVVTGAKGELDTDGVFIYVGHFPNSSLFQGVLEMDEQGFVLTDERKRTNVRGVFVGGELSDPIFRQAITSSGEGCKAAMQAEKYLSDIEGEPEYASSQGRSLGSW